MWQWVLVATEEGYTVGVSSQGLIPQSEGDTGVTVVLFFVISHNLLILSDRSTCALD